MIFAKFKITAKIRMMKSVKVLLFYNWSQLDNTRRGCGLEDGKELHLLYF